MADRVLRIGRAGRAALAVAAALSSGPARAADRAPPQGPPASLDELLVRRGRPDVYAAGVAECVSYDAGTAQDPPLLWYLFPRGGRTGPVRTVQGLGREALAEIDWSCGPVAAAHARIAAATCTGPATLERALRSAELLDHRLPPLPPALGWARRPERGPLAAGEGLGCARVVTSRDGRVRIWTALRERLVELDEQDPGGVGVRRGVAFVQWLDGEGRVSVHRDRSGGEDLHLDSVVDALEPIPGARGRYLVTGARAFDARAPAALPRRWAFVLQTTAEGPRLVRGAFRLGDARRDLLLLQGRGPALGLFRHHALAWRQLALSPDDAALHLAPLEESPLPGRSVERPEEAVVARWSDGAFQVAGRYWDATLITPGDGRVWLSDRWGAIAELGPRDERELLASGPRGGAARDGDALGPFVARRGR